MTADKRPDIDPDLVARLDALKVDVCEAGASTFRLVSRVELSAEGLTATFRDWGAEVEPFQTPGHLGIFDLKSVDEVEWWLAKFERHDIEGPMPGTFTVFTKDDGVLSVRSTASATDNALAEHKRFGTFPKHGSSGNELRTAWDFTTVAYVTPEALALVVQLADRMDEAEDADFGEAERSRVPWRNVPTLVVYPTAHEVETFRHVSNLPRGVHQFFMSSSWFLPSGIAPAFEIADLAHRLPDGTMERSGEPLPAEPGDIDAVTVWVRSATNNKLTVGLLPWNGARLLPDPEIGYHDRMTVEEWALTRLFAAGKVVLAEPENMTKPERRRVERANVSARVVRPTRQGDVIDGFLPGVMKDRQHFTADGLPKQNLTVERADEIITTNPAMRSYRCGVCGNLHVGHGPVG